MNGFIINEQAELCFLFEYPIKKILFKKNERVLPLKVSNIK